MKRGIYDDNRKDDPLYGMAVSRGICRCILDGCYSSDNKLCQIGGYPWIL